MPGRMIIRQTRAKITSCPEKKCYLEIKISTIFQRTQATNIMAKKRKASGPPAVEDTPAGWNERGGKLGPINTFEDVADSEDEFHINRDNILLEDGPDTKRIRKWQEEGTSAPIPFEKDLLIKATYRRVTRILRRGSTGIFLGE